MLVSYPEALKVLTKLYQVMCISSVMVFGQSLVDTGHLIGCGKKWTIVRKFSAILWEGSDDYTGCNKSIKIDDRQGNQYIDITRYYSILINRLVKIIDKYR